MKELIENGYLYIATPPLYLVKKGKQAKYAWDDKEREQHVQGMKGSEANLVFMFKDTKALEK
jgi:DNA gyrase subunit B